ncbi:MAG: phosphoglucosamine mutase [Pyrinomonadaceae bacterium]
MNQLFGTDGIRGLAGEFPLDEKTVRIIGASLARRFRNNLGREPRFISGRDTRESGGWIESAFHAGAVVENAVCASAGVIPTPGVAYLTKALKYDAGIVISASHNPYYDNGIKFFLPTGMKIDEATEGLIEQDIHSGVSIGGTSDAVVNSGSEAAFRMTYSMHLIGVADTIKKIDGLKIVIDCANGAASKFAATVFRRLGTVVIIKGKPDGRNINDNCGSTHIDGLRSKVLEERADLGIAFDGDADRALFVDENGDLVDGDATLWIMAGHLKDHGKLAHSTVVATVMSNIGLELAFKSKGINLLRTDVGDKYVLEKLIETGSEIGGEQSGHIMFPERSLVGDGMMTALLVLRAITEKKISLSRATDGFVRYPQILINVKVAEKRPFSDVPEIASAARQVESELHGEGRLLLRYSGTENLARVMIEGKDQVSIETQARRLISVIENTLG